MITVNTGKSVFAAIERIAATSSKNEKDALIKAAGSMSSLFLKAVTYAYDPFKNYGIANAPTKTPGIAPGANSLEEPWVFEVLDDLVSRKLSGDAARAKVQNTIDLLDDASSEVFRRIINKNMRAGFSEGSINRSFKGTIAEFPYMRCSLPPKSNIDKLPWADGVLSQEKADGMFANVNLDEKGYLWITSRQGSLFPENCLGIEQDLKTFLVPYSQTHGEFTVYENGVLMPRAEGNGVLNSLLEGGTLASNQRVVFQAWDQIPLNAVVPGGKYATPYKKRLGAIALQCRNAQLKGVVSVQLIPTRIVTSLKEAYAHFRELLKKGKEGTVIKSPLAIWQDTTSKDQIKLKLEFEVDLEVVAILPGRPDTKNAKRAGSLACKSACGGLMVDVTVKNEAMRDDVDANPGNWVGSIIPVIANDLLEPSESNDLHSLFLPRMAEAAYRKDKTVADDLARIKLIYEAAIEGRKLA